MKFVLTFILFMIIFILAIAIGSGNDQWITFNYLIAESTFRLSTLIALAFGGGFVLAWILCGFFLFRMKIRLSTSQRQLKKLQDEQMKWQAEQQKKELETV